MEEELDILIRQTAQSIEKDKGLSAMFATSAAEKQRLLSALMSARGQIAEKDRMYQEEHALRTRAEEALAVERARPLNYITLPDREEAESVYPRKGKYADTVVWLAEQKKKGVDFYAAAGYNRTEMCRKLTKIFGWEVNENSLRKAQEEADKHEKLADSQKLGKIS